ncbi:uncharacterized protein JCM15063_001168 [Sporobolomyces koalae]|uniref:uncharacterized protein n=1 Tax=Sporobolomyces koalae TaxID=500713 RepID=UPI0031710C2A
MGLDYFARVCDAKSPTDTDALLWCVTKEGVCCGVCPDTLASLGTRVGLSAAVFFATVVVIIEGPEAPFVFLTTSLQALAHLLVLLWEGLGGRGISRFHAYYALLCSFGWMSPIAAAAFTATHYGYGGDHQNSGTRLPAYRTDLVRSETYRSLRKSSEDTKHPQGIMNRSRLNYMDCIAAQRRDSANTVYTYGQLQEIANRVHGGRWRRRGYPLAIALLWTAWLVAFLFIHISPSFFSLAQTNCPDPNGTVVLKHSSIVFLALGPPIVLAFRLNYHTKDLPHQLRRVFDFNRDGSLWTRALLPATFSGVIFALWQALLWYSYALASQPDSSLLAATEQSASYATVLSLALTIKPAADLLKALTKMHKRKMLERNPGDQCSTPQGLTPTVLPEVVPLTLPNFEPLTPPSIPMNHANPMSRLSTASKTPTFPDHLSASSRRRSRQ